MTREGVDAADVRRKVEKARALVRGRSARLVGFEAVEIQRFVAASSRPITIQGACEALKAFDARNAVLPETIFAGGARGVMLVAEDRLAACIDQLTAAFTEQTVGLSLAIADVPFDPAREPESLRWLWLAQRSAHDACAPERIDFAAFRGASCTDCRARPGERPSPKPEAPASEKVCRRCDALIKQGRRSQDATMERWTLEEVSEGGLVSVVNADGNRLGQFFRSLGSLEALCAGSLAVSEIFQKAHLAAIDRAGGPKHIAPVTGGDDIKVFLPPTAALEYVYALMISVEAGARHAGDVGGLLAGQPVQRLAELSAGVGLLIAPFHVPATRLVDLAHELEDEAKRQGGGRSAVCFTVHRADAEPDDRAHETFGVKAWPELLRRARLLRDTVPRGQRAAIAAAWELDEAERENQILWQIARSRAWQGWYEACGEDWRNRESALRALQTRSVLSLAGLGGRGA
jgi:hypothetical protein